jgi:TPR repeat protein
MCAAVIGAAGALWSEGKKNTVDPNLTDAARLLRERAERGEAEAQRQLGNIYARGEGVPRDYAEAVLWFRKAAERGDAKAQVALAEAYYWGNGVPRDYAEAVRWARTAAEAGDAEAEYALAVSYSEGKGVPQDPREALRWYHIAAGQGYAKALNALGYIYRSGAGVPQDYAEAFRWYRKAAELGNADAQYAAGFMYRKGQGVARNDIEAVRWFAKAASQGNASARKTLHSMRCEDALAQFSSWTSPVAILLALPILVVPKRRWGRNKWIPSALCSAVCAVALIHELRLSPLSLALYAQSHLGLIWRGFGRVLFLALLGAGSAIFAAMAARAAVREPSR